MLNPSHDESMASDVSIPYISFAATGYSLILPCFYSALGPQMLTWMIKPSTSFHPAEYATEDSISDSLPLDVLEAKTPPVEYTLVAAFSSHQEDTLTNQDSPMA